jgi:RNA polymerase sigma-70 factor (ECF subfamily)
VADERFNKLVADYGGKVLHIAQGVLGDSQAAMDVHQEVFLAIWKRWSTYDSQVNWDGYLYRTTIRKALDYAQKSRKEKALDPEYEKQIPSGSPPESGARAGELISRLRLCLRQLPAQQAQAFVLARMEGMGYPQIAETMGCTEGTARVHLHRALKQLAHQMRDLL